MDRISRRARALAAPFFSTTARLSIAALVAAGVPVAASAIAGCGTPAPMMMMTMMPPPATVASFDRSADLTSPDHFYDFPFPSDLRLVAGGGPDLTGFPNPRALRSVNQLRESAQKRKGYPVVPVAYFQFSAPLPPQDASVTIPASAASPILLVDLAPMDPSLALLPTVADLPVNDGFAPDNLLAVAPRPGFVLRGKHSYAFVVMRSLKDAAGNLLGVSAGLSSLISGATAGGTLDAATELYAPLWPALHAAGVDPADVACATVFTTDDFVVETSRIADGLSAKYQATITALSLAPMGDTYDRFCYLAGTVRYPQFQVGVAPFNTEGEFSFDSDNLPIKQSDEDVPFVITLPWGEMPSAGYPLMVYFHGSGGLSTYVVERGPDHVKDGPYDRGKGPAYVVAPFGIAAAGSALPLNPERFPGASDFEYLNLANLAAFRDTFRQGVIEQHMFIEALRTLEIDPSALSVCKGNSLPKDGSATKYKFDPDKLVASGQSMGGMYTNMVGSTVPRIKAVVPTGAGGFWSYMMLVTNAIPGVVEIVGDVLGTSETITFLHPGTQLIEMSWEPADPFIYMPRLARDPLPGHPVRPVYEPVGKDDIYFPTVLYDAVALSYGHQESGDEIWPTMQTALSLQHLDGILPYPVTQNRMSYTGVPYTGTVVQYNSDGIDDAHYIYAQLDTVKYQYGCFLSTFLSTGKAIVGAPLALGMPCPQ